jgi:hypothetical protein
LHAKLDNTHPHSGLGALQQGKLHAIWLGSKVKAPLAIGTFASCDAAVYPGKLFSGCANEQGDDKDLHHPAKALLARAARCGDDVDLGEGLPTPRRGIAKLQSNFSLPLCHPRD